MHFETAFDLAEVGYKSWYWPAFGLVFAAVNGTFLLFPGLARSVFSLGGLLAYRPNQFLRWVGFIVPVIWTIFVFTDGYGEYLAARDALVSGHYDVVEGIVTEFKPMPYSGHGYESFVVAGRTFSYSDFGIITAGFNHTRSHGGPIDNGIYVRVAYTGNTIFRLEIAR
jgi:hypothetical protein